MSISMHQNDSNSTSSNSSSSNSSSNSNSSRSSIRREAGDDDNKDDDDDVGVDVADNPAPVACPEQMVEYCKTFNLIDKGNANVGSKTHERTTKLSFRLFNMTLNNAYRNYTCLHKRHHQQEGG